MAKRERAKFNIPMVVACVLLCLTMFSTHFASDIFARYTTRADGKDLARVAGFGEIIIEEMGDFETGLAYMIPGVDLTKKATISFGPTELSTYVFIKVETASNWAIKIDDLDDHTYTAVNGKVSWKINSDWEFLTRSIGETVVRVYYKKLDPNETIDKIDIIADGGKITVSDTITRKEFPDPGKEYFINLSAIAVQASGFETAADAWASASK